MSSSPSGCVAAGSSAAGSSSAGGSGAAAAAAYQSMRLAAGCEPDEADTAENILAADKIAADTDATIEL